MSERAGSAGAGSGTALPATYGGGGGAGNSSSASPAGREMDGGANSDDAGGAAACGPQSAADVSNSGAAADDAVDDVTGAPAPYEPRGPPAVTCTDAHSWRRRTQRAKLQKTPEKNLTRRT